MKGDGRVFQRGGVWWIAYRYGGREYRESSRSRHRNEAFRLLRQRVAEVTAGFLQNRTVHPRPAVAAPLPPKGGQHER